jgi:hypothetical protein
MTTLDIKNFAAVDIHEGAIAIFPKSRQKELALETSRDWSKEEKSLYILVLSPFLLLVPDNDMSVVVDRRTFNIDDTMVELDTWD